MKQIAIQLLKYSESELAHKLVLTKRVKGETRLYFSKGYDPRVSADQFMELLDDLVSSGWRMEITKTGSKTSRNFTTYVTIKSPEGLIYTGFGISARYAICQAAFKAAAEWHV